MLRNNQQEEMYLWILLAHFLERRNPQEMCQPMNRINRQQMQENMDTMQICLT